MSRKITKSFYFIIFQIKIEYNNLKVNVCLFVRLSDLRLFSVCCERNQNLLISVQEGGEGLRGANFLKTFAYKNAIKAKLGNLPAILPESLDPRQKFELPLPWIIKFSTRVHPWSNFKPIGT